MNCLLCRKVLCDSDFDGLPEVELVRLFKLMCKDCVQHVLVYLDIVKEINQVV